MPIGNQTILKGMDMKIALTLLLTSTTLWGQTSGVSQTTGDGDYNTSSRQAPTEVIQHHLSPEGKEGFIGNFVYAFVNEMCEEYRSMESQNVPQQNKNEEAKKVLDLFDNNYVSAIKENPELAKAFKNDVKNWQDNENCSGNAIPSCRAKLVAIYSYYTKYLRPNLPECVNKNKNKNKNQSIDQSINYCEIEKENWSKSLKSLSRPIGLPDVSGYLNKLNDIVIINDQIIKNLMLRDNSSGTPMGWFHCNPKKKMDEEFLPIIINWEPSYKGLSVKPVPVELNSTEPKEKVVLTTPKGEPCKEEKKVSKSANVFADFKTGESILQPAQTTAVIEGVRKLRKDNVNIIVTDIEILAVSSHSPYRGCEKSKEGPEECNYKRNLALANLRARSGMNAVVEAIRTDENFKNASISTGGKVSGPLYSKIDVGLKSQKVTNELMEKMKASFPDMYKSDAILSEEEMKDPKRIENMFDFKFKPFQGFKIIIKGFDTETYDCDDRKGVENSGSKPGNTKSGNSDAAAQ